MLNLVNSSFEHVLHSYGLHLVSTYKYEIGNCLFDSISYLLDNHLSSLRLRQNNMAHLNQCLLLNTKKNPTMSYSRFKSKFFVLFASRHGHK
jgi:hypothetical protein